MLFLSNNERSAWSEALAEIQADRINPDQFNYRGRPNIRSAFDFHAGTVLSATGDPETGRAWINAGALIEESDLFLNTFLMGFLERHDDRLIMPETVFADPRPYIHFTTVPVIRESRVRLLTHCAQSLPEFKRPFRMIDIGCGDGGLAASLLKHLRDSGIIHDVGELLLVDPSEAMLKLARETVNGAMPGIPIKTLHGRFEQVSGRIDGHYDLAVCSLSYHHMPYELKEIHLGELKKHIDNLILFELDANNDLPELHSPDLALSVYQSYGRMTHFVFSHDAPVEVAQGCVDRFLMTEAVSLLTQPRGERNDYHMTRQQWLELFDKTLAPDFRKLCDSICYADDYFALFTTHYGRG